MLLDFKPELEVLVFEKKSAKLKILEAMIQTKINNKIEVINKRYQLKLKKYQESCQKKIAHAKFKMSQKVEIINQQIDLLIKDERKSDLLNLKVVQLKPKKQFVMADYKTKETKYNNYYQEQIEKLTKWHQEQIEDYQMSLSTFEKNFINNIEEYQSYKTNKLNLAFDKKVYQSQYTIQSQILKEKIKVEQDKSKRQELIKAKRDLPFLIKENHNLVFNPLPVQIANKKNESKNKIINWAKSWKNKFIQLKYLSFKDILSLKLFEIPLFLYLISLVVITIAIITNTVSKESMGALAILFVIAIVAGEIFSRVPIWKTFVGRGTMGVFFIGALLGTFNIIPKEINEGVKSFFSAGGFLNLYINVLIVGSILTIPKKLILSSFSGFMFLIASGTILAVGIGFGLGTMFGLSNDKTILQFMLPLLGDGNGGGVQPLSRMAEAYGYMPRGQEFCFSCKLV